ncbi:hypothetical protein FKP32DRAFT_1677747 [Trametes sanguinea]|nr:hypothetical protein FKP32DRAFT_1677747 [Trametes sanguinea]
MPDSGDSNDSNVLLSASQECLTVGGIFFTTLCAGQPSSPWIPATIASVFNLNQSSADVTSHNWVVGLYPPAPHEPHLVGLMSTNWTLHWEETIGIVILCDEIQGQVVLSHSLLFLNREDFLNFVFMCCNIKMLLYTGTMLSLRAD